MATDSTVRRSPRLLTKRPVTSQMTTKDPQPLIKRAKLSEGPETSISILDVHTGDIVSIALEERDLCQDIAWLVKKIEGELKNAMVVPEGKLVCLQRLYVGTISVLSDWRPHSIEYYLLDGDVWMMDWVVVETVGFEICVKTNIGSVINLEAKGSYRIWEIKQAIMEESGFPCDQQRLIYDRRALDDCCFVQEYGIKSGDVLYLVLRLRGGGCAVGSIKFADISKTSALKREQWSESAPPWRIADRGLCIEGKCTTKACQAYNQDVIVNVGFGHFDLENHTEYCTCPMCDGPVDVVTCAFNNCRWKWVGKKVVSPSSPPIVVRGEWKEADDAYHRFDEKESGKAKWLLLKITTEPLGAGSSERGLCVICLKRHSSEGYSTLPCQHTYHSSEGYSTLPCQHTYHSQCITGWLSRNETCPLCRAVASMSTLMKKAAGLQ